VTSALVVAHPDDEALWFSGSLRVVSRVVVCFGDQFDGGAKNARRAKALADLPVPGLVALNITESGTRQLVDWARAGETDFGIDIAEPEGRARYEANFAVLVERLRTQLAGVREVVTHNPWGEYGHPEHVQVYRAVRALQGALGFRLWVSNYAAPLSAGFAGRVEARWVNKRALPTDGAYARRLQGVYLRYRVWTWPVLHRWPRGEVLYEVAPQGQSFAGEVMWDCAKLRLWRALGRVTLPGVSRG
jgi:LmbE family N-acetylglucosaminyl deacetylase